MQPLTLTLPGVVCSQLEVRCPIRTSGGFGSVKPMVCRAGFARRRLNAFVQRTGAGQAVVAAARTSKRRSVKATATAEGGTDDVLTLKAEPELEQVGTEPEVAQETASGVANVDEKEDSSPKVNVKFTLQKQCHFGQQFNVVGDIPELGEWDPSRAVPLEWSEEHVWTAQVPIRTGLNVEYKFVMTGRRLELVWQPGENGVFETKDENEFTVSGVWNESDLEDTSVADAVKEPEGTGEIEGVTEENAPSTNGFATGSLDSDLQKVATVAEEAIEGVIATLDEGSKSLDAVEAHTTEEEKENPPETPEIPVVEGVLASAVAEEAGGEKGTSKSEEDDVRSSSSPVSIMQNDFEWSVRTLASLFKGSEKEDE
ncbi:hypothetical protein R1sor_019506 [Riccia sorocarpa]|uniref:CBM20 domain-containing protein n=1 Tax=Riccia sorocarpa TaxID=122646 RepID=A0ABD3IEG1_9MARC